MFKLIARVLVLRIVTIHSILVDLADIAGLIPHMLAKLFVVSLLTRVAQFRLDPAQVVTSAATDGLRWFATSLHRGFSGLCEGAPTTAQAALHKERGNFDPP